MINGEKILVARHSAFQEISLVEEASGLRTLSFGADGVTQSVVDVADPRRLELPYARTLPACLAFARTLRRMLIVGLGGGTLPRFFHSQFPRMVVDVVELDPDVLALATEHCGFREDARLRAHVEDGRDFIKAHGDAFDVIVLDSFSAEAIPSHLTTLEFLGEVRRALVPDGIAIANVWGRSSNPLFASMLLTYRAAFEDVYIFDVPARTAKLFVALPRRQMMTREGLLELVREFSREHAFGYDLAGTVAGFRHAELETIRGGAVLRD
jgi:spermidine synthase